MEANNYLYTSYSETESSESEDDYINMEVDSSFQNNSNNNNMFMMMSRHSATINKEFEFQSFSSSSDKDQTTTSPADELFYMGKILPLHLPPRLEALHKILQIPKKSHEKQENEEEEEEEDFGFGSTPLYSTPTANTPFQSCNISPSESCHVSRELNPAEYFADYLSELQQNKKSWTTTERVTKPTKSNSSSSRIGSKLKWAYLKSLFTTSAGCAAADQRQFQNVKHGGLSKKTDDKSHHHVPFGQIKSKKISSHDHFSKKDNVNNLVEDHHHNHNHNYNHKKGSGHRRSFSGVFKRVSKTNCPSTISSSTNRHVSKSSSEVHDNSIQAAIAHCKRSSQKEEELQSRQIAKERAFCSISASYI